jgi:hypothetical protein
MGIRVADPLTNSTGECYFLIWVRIVFYPYNRGRTDYTMRFNAKNLNVGSQPGSLCVMFDIADYKAYTSSITKRT